MLGEKSGCLEIVGCYEDIIDELKKAEKESAEEEWNRFNRWWKWKADSFEKYYKLNNEEKIAYQNKDIMPQSFIEKYLEQEIPSVYKKPFLFHKSQPNTSDSLINAYKNKELIKVRCNKCNCEWITDYTSFSSIKWRSCSGAECYKSTIKDNKNHADSLYSFNNLDYKLKEIDSTLLTVAEMGNQLSYYSVPQNEFAPQLKISYISDVHILHHIKNNNVNIEKTIKKIAKELADSLPMRGIIIFNGDIASDSNVVISFYKTFIDYANKKRNVNGIIYATLGNHEFIGFKDVNSAVDFYRKELEDLGITLLYNDSYILGNNSILIYGGTGFAKYNNNYNANNIVACDNFTREDEIKETNDFENEYKECLNYAKENNMCFISISHYPVEDCLNGKYDKETIYFTGHNHNNYYCRNENKTLYADNQIGYKQKHFTFKIMTTGFETNPYSYMEDGLFITSIEDYLKFYRYIGENIGDGSSIYQRCEGGKANLYVVKHNGYYGFFIMNPNGASKGISIVNGGVTKKISKSTDMKWICDNFDIVLTKYLKALLPLRTLQENISKELKELGFSGTIHGTIVDIDFYHHIMINPVDGTIQLYYSPFFGGVTYFNNFSQALDSIKKKKTSDIDINKVQKYISSKKTDEKYELLNINNEHDLTLIDNESEVDNSLYMVSRTEGAYGISRKVNPLQRLFSGRVLRDFDLKLTETKQEAYRSKVYLGQIVIYNGEKCQITEDNGGDFVTINKVYENSYSNEVAVDYSVQITINEVKKLTPCKQGWTSLLIRNENITLEEVVLALAWHDYNSKIPNFPYTQKIKYYGYYEDEIRAEDSLIKEFLYKIPQEYYSDSENTFHIISRIEFSSLHTLPDYAWNNKVIKIILEKYSTKTVIENLDYFPSFVKTEAFYKHIRGLLKHKNRPKWCPKEIWGIKL